MFQVTEVDGTQVNFDYDAIYQLVSAQRGPTTYPYFVTYAYDAVGNRLSSTDGGATTNYTVNAANQILTAKLGGSTVTYAYDNNGNNSVKNDNGYITTQVWDEENRLTGIIYSDATPDTFSYTGDGRFLQKQYDGGAVRFVLDGPNIIQQEDSTDYVHFTTDEYYTNLPGVVGGLSSQAGRAADQPYFQEAVIDVDGTIAETLGGCKEGMGMSHKGIWGYHPLLATLANTGEVLYLVNRPGNDASQSDAPEWLERAIAVVKPRSERICLRGDSAFSLTGQFDGWDDRGIDFVFGTDANLCFKSMADRLVEESWKELERLPKYEVRTKPRGRRERVKEAMVRERKYKNIRLRCEHVAEFWHQPGKCDRPYRVIALRKNLSVERGDMVLYDDIRYFFYITNRTDLSASEVVRFINGRCDQENVIEQMKNGVHALKMPVDGLNSNWAYAVMASLAWNLKVWCGLFMPDEGTGNTILRLEFRGFLHRFIMVPCQILRSGRGLVYRMLGYNRWLEDWLALARSLRPRLQGY